MESDLSGLDFSVFLVNFVPNQNDWDVVANSGQVFVPFGDIFICNSGGNIEHEDGGIGANVISFSEATELFLAGCIPKRKLDGAMIGVKSDGADFNTLRSDVFLFEFTGNVSFDESGLSNTTVTDEHNLELSNDLRSLS